MIPLEEREKILKEILKPAFKLAGFKKSGNNFIKTEDRFIKVFSVENSSWNTKDSVSFDLNVGIFFPIVYEIQNKPIPKTLFAGGCHFNMHIGQLNNSNRLFNIYLDTNINELREYIYEAIHHRVIPFFERYNTIEDCIDLQTTYISYSFDINPFIGLTLLEKGNIKKGNKLMENIRPSYTEDFKKLLLDHRDYLILKFNTTTGTK